MPNILSCSVGDLFVNINNTTFDDKEELMEEILRLREKCNHGKKMFITFFHSN